MNQNRAIEDFTGNKDDEIVTIATSVIEGLTTNPNFIFTTQLTDLVSAVSTYSTKLGLVKTGNNTAATAKDNAKVIVEVKLAVISRAVNLQAHGDLIKLQSSGLPLVAFDIGGMPDVIKHSKNGYLTTPFNCEEFACNIASALNNRDKLGRYSRLLAFNNFSIDIFNKEIKKIGELNDSY